MKRWQANALMVGMTLIWGMTFVITKNALDSVGPLTFVAWRFWVATGGLIVLFHRRLRAMTRADFTAGALTGIWLAMGYILQTVGLQYTTSGKSAFITGLSVVLVPVFAALWLRQPPGRGAVLGVIAATAGLALLSLGNNGLQFGPGDLWTLGCAVGFALQIVTVARYAPHRDPVRLAVVQIGTAAILATVSAFLFETPTLALSLETWAVIAFMGLVATALVFSLQVFIQRLTTPTQTALIFSLEPVFGAFFGWWWAGEVLGPKEIAGCGLILAGMLLAEFGGQAEDDDIPKTCPAD
jgi:drug/metabolite transporter (DMT)-like permease